MVVVNLKRLSYKSPRMSRQTGETLQSLYPALGP
jgi:hypothetical protein